MKQEKVVCARCIWESTGINQGFIRGLCSECSETIRVKALQRGIYLRMRPGFEPMPSQRERTVDGLHLWWWKGQWRIQ
jgi:hypothetical protein